MATISSIISELEKEVHRLMGDFISHGATAKQLLDRGSPVEEIFGEYQKMAAIVKELLPVRELVREVYPAYADFFDALSHMVEGPIESQSFDDALELCSFDSSEKTSESL